MADPRTFARAYEQYRTEARERLENAVDALRGETPMSEPQMSQPTSGGLEYQLECPTRSSHEHLINPDAALLAHISREERLYLTAGELQAYFEDADREFQPTTGYGASFTIGEILRQMHHRLRSEAIEAARKRMVLSETAHGYEIEDPNTGYKARVGMQGYMSRSERRDRALQRVGDVAREQLERLERRLQDRPVEVGL